MSQARALCQLLAQPEIVVAPGAYDGLTARLVEKSGFRAVYLTGAGVSYSALGRPDLGLVSLTEMVERAAQVGQAVGIPVIADADTGHGRPLNVIRTVREYERAGVAAIQLEDQSFPKRCGHLARKSLTANPSKRPMPGEERMIGRLEGRVAIVTGGSRGIGRAVALAFAQEGADVAVVGARDPGALSEVEREISSLGRRALAAIVDVTQRGEVSKLVQRVLESWGRIDILVNNAGIIHPTPLEEIPEAQWDQVVGVHLKGTFNCTQAVLPAMKRERRGKIINVAAPSALRGAVGVADYAAAKGGIIAFTRNAATEFRPYNIQVNCISPVARTRMTDRLDAFRRERLGEQGTATPPQRASADAVAPAFVFFASGDSDYITGQVLAVDGGLTL